MADSGDSDKVQSPSLVVAQVTDVQRELANQALIEFDNKNYAACCTHLNKLSSQRSNDPHVLHNKAVAEFYLSDCQRVEGLRRSLNQICYMCHLSPENAQCLDDVDHACVYYNQAVLLYHLRQHNAALLIIDSLFQLVEPMDEELCKKVMFLLVELYLSTQQPEKSMGLLAYVERSLRGVPGDKESSDKPDKEGKEGADGSLSAMWKSRISEYKMRCYMMMKSFKFCKREMKFLSTTSNPCSAMFFGFLKSNFEYLRGNFRKAIKILVSTPQTPAITENGQYLPVMYFNNLSCVHFNLGKHHLATFYLRKALGENEKVLAEVSRDQQDKTSLSGRHLNRLSISRHLELAYNLGIELLHSNQPLTAFDCLLQAANLYSSNPRLWLRLAECCIMAYRMNNEVDSNLALRQGVIQGSVGTGYHRKLILGTGCHLRPNASQSPAVPAATLEFASLCLRNALSLLPDSNQSHTSGEQSANSGSKSDVKLVRAPPSNPMRGPEVVNLRSSILCSSAYVALCLNDHVLALRHATRLLAQPTLSTAHRYLGHMYVAEALVTADRIAEAIEQLNPQSVTEISTTPPQIKLDSEKSDGKGEKSEKEGDSNGENNGGILHSWFPRDVTKARAFMQYNLAASYALRGDFTKSRLNLVESAAAYGSPMPTQMYYLRLYLDLIEGRRGMAQVIIKEHFGHTTPNRPDANAESAVITAR